MLSNRKEKRHEWSVMAITPPPPLNTVWGGGGTEGEAGALRLKDFEEGPLLPAPCRLVWWGC